jgi:hypothetical protein
MEDYLHATRLQNSLKKRIKQLLKEREVEAKKKEDEAREALRKAEEERKAMENASVLMKEKMKQAEMIDGDEDENIRVEKASHPSPHFSPAPLPGSIAKMEARTTEITRTEYEKEMARKAAEEELLACFEDTSVKPAKKKKKGKKMSGAASCIEEEVIQDDFTRPPAEGSNVGDYFDREKAYHD